MKVSLEMVRLFCFENNLTHVLLIFPYFPDIYDKAGLAVFSAFVGTPRFFTESQITNAENWLGISRKKGSTTAEQANLPVNLQRRYTFWHGPHPVGIFGTSRSRIIDFDEAAIFLETIGRSYGKCHISTRVNEPGPYNHSEKYTLTAAIRGGPNGVCWWNLQL